MAQRWSICRIAIVMMGIVGCGHAATHNIVGTWNISGGPGKATMAFQADGNFRTDATMPGRSSSVTGQYKMSGDTVTLQTMQTRTATLKWNNEDEFVMTGDDGKAMTLDRQK